MPASGAISKIALIFVSSEDFDTQLNKTLAIVGEYLGISHCYLFLDSADGATTTNTHEWCAEGAEPQIANMQNLSYSSFPFWKNILENEMICAIDDVDYLPEDIRSLLEPQGIRSIIVAPLREGNRVHGFLGFNECARLRSWSEIEIETLKTISGIITAAYSRKLLMSAEQDALQKFEKLFRSNPAPMGVSRVDDLRFIDVNESFLETFGYSSEEVIGKSSLELGLFMDDQQLLSGKAKLLRAGALRKREVVLRRKDGNLIHGLFSGDTIDSRGQKYFLSVMGDITDQIKLRTDLQNDLQTQHNRLAHIIEAARLGAWEWNIQTGQTVFNERWAEIIGYTLAELEPTTIDTNRRFTHPDDVEKSKSLLNLHFEGISDYYEIESRMRHKDGSWVWVFDRGKVIERDNEGRPLKMYGTHADITREKNMEQRIRELAIRDPLTEVYNRRYIFKRFDEVVAEYLRCGRNFCVAILDIDYFKRVNDTYGHLAGDFVLREFALTISSTIRPYDLLGRYGGEEFIVVSPNTRGSGAAAMIERVMGLVRGKTFMFEGHEIRFTFSCGFADSSEFARDEFSIGAMVALADKRLYAAKEGGRDCYVGL
jgi:diguanylate cyclase (GGDEF)-like protein/PAS domain S-box-containing protein